MSFSGKTLIVQSAALHLAAGLVPWRVGGHGGVAGERCDPIRVLHIDHEQGEWATRKRYQRLRAGIEIDQKKKLDLGDRLQLVPHPDVYLSDAAAVDTFIRELEGKELGLDKVDLCIIDSLKATTPGVDENDSRMGDVMYRLLAISEKTGAAIVLIHHEGKPKAGSGGDERHAGRGSSAIFAGAGSVIRIQCKEGDHAKEVSFSKSSVSAGGELPEKFYLRFLDVPHEVDKEHGALCIEYLTMGTYRDRYGRDGDYPKPFPSEQGSAAPPRPSGAKGNAGRGTGAQGKPFYED